MWYSGTQNKSLMTKWLGQVSQGHEIYCHDLEAMGSTWMVVLLFKVSAYKMSCKGKSTGRI